MAGKKRHMAGKMRQWLVKRVWYSLSLLASLLASKRACKSKRCDWNQASKQACKQAQNIPNALYRALTFLYRTFAVVYRTFDGRFCGRRAPAAYGAECPRPYVAKHTHICVRLRSFRTWTSAATSATTATYFRLYHCARLSVVGTAAAVVSKYK